MSLPACIWPGAWRRWRDGWSPLRPPACVRKLLGRASRAWMKNPGQDSFKVLDSEEATQAAWAFILRMVSDSGSSSPDVLVRFLTHAPRPQVRQRTVALAAAVGTMPSGPLANLAFLPTASEPLPCRLTTQDLVELLKMPTCVGPVRRVILDQLGNRYGRRFDTHWDFVRYAQQQRLNLDFTTPPKRPDRKLPPLFQE